GDCEQSRELSVDRDVDDGGAVSAQAFAVGIEQRRLDTEGCQEIRIAKQNGFAVDLAGDALAGRRIEFVNLAQIETALLGGADDRVRKRMLAGALDAGG